MDIIATVVSALSYDPDTGILSWRVRPERSKTWNSRYAGTAAGKLRPDGRRSISISGRCILSYRAAWVIMTGMLPPDHVDHINGDPSDDRWSNLRLASGSENNMNRGKSPRNTSGEVGVSWCQLRRRWTARVMVRRKIVYSAYFPDFDSAVAARRKAIVEFHGEFARVA